MVHHPKVGMHVGGKIRLIYDENVALRNSGAIFAWDFVAGSHVDDVYKEVHQGWRECQGQIIATTLYKHYVGIRKFIEGSSLTAV